MMYIHLEGEESGRVWIQQGPTAHRIPPLLADTLGMISIWGGPDRIGPQFQSWLFSLDCLPAAQVAINKMGYDEVQIFSEDMLSQFDWVYSFHQEGGRR